MDELEVKKEETDDVTKEGTVMEYTVDMQELDAKIKSMTAVSEVNRDSKGEKARVCTVCGKEGQGIVIKDHIEKHHITGVSHSCNLCEITCKTRATLKTHKRKRHTHQMQIFSLYDVQQEV
jgi:hypothetical protein